MTYRVLHLSGAAGEPAITVVDSDKLVTAEAHVGELALISFHRERSDDDAPLLVVPAHYLVAIEKIDRIQEQAA